MYEGTKISFRSSGSVPCHTSRNTIVNRNTADDFIDTNNTDKPSRDKPILEVHNAIPNLPLTLSILPHAYLLLVPPKYSTNSVENTRAISYTHCWHYQSWLIISKPKHKFTSWGLKSFLIDAVIDDKWSSALYLISNTKILRENGWEMRKREFQEKWM